MGYEHRRLVIGDDARQEARAVITVLSSAGYVVIGTGTISITKVDFELPAAVGGEHPVVMPLPGRRRAQWKPEWKGRRR